MVENVLLKIRKKNCPTRPLFPNLENYLIQKNNCPTRPIFTQSRWPAVIKKIRMAWPPHAPATSPTTQTSPRLPPPTPWNPLPPRPARPFTGVKVSRRYRLTCAHPPYKGPRAPRFPGPWVLLPPATCEPPPDHPVAADPLCLYWNNYIYQSCWRPQPRPPK